MNKLAYIIIIYTFFFTLKDISAQSEWLEYNTEHFQIVYKESHAHLIPKISESAENAFTRLKKIFEYEPSEKIVINTYDVYDYGFGTATSVPQNFIRLEVEPFEPGYEIVPYNDRLQWLISHELVHIIVNDQASDLESYSRAIFSKVPPEQIEPLTIFYSLLTNYNRYTPRWHQEAIAVYLETWLSGGYGRIFSNFNEMYFRTMVLDNEEFSSHLKLEALDSHNSFLLETLFYLYGTRFATYLTLKYDSTKFLEWFKERSDNFYDGFVNAFKKIYGITLEKAWEDFITYEKKIQEENIRKLVNSPLTPIRRIFDEPIGWVSQPYFDVKNNSIYLAYHKPHNLSSIYKINLNDFTSNELGPLPTPSMNQVASTAFDNSFGFFFYTTNNNQLFRDIWVLDIKTKEKKLLFSDVRIGHLTVSSTSHELWGIKHSGGKASLVYSAYPYRAIIPVVGFEVGDEIYQLSVSPSGKYLAAILHRSNGQQSLIWIDLQKLKAGESFKFLTISEIGTPENPSWSMNEKYIFWNAYTNGVSNIYKINLDNSKIEPLSHTIRGLFKPVQMSEDSLFAFEFTADGFAPVIIPDQPAEYLPAIDYLGQQILDKNPQVADWILKPVNVKEKIENKDEYNGFSNFKILSFVPVITGFQIQKVVGLFTHISDPLINHDIILELGYSPFNERAIGPKWHLKLKYDYKKKFEFGLDHNATDFYDLFNTRKRGMIGTKIRLGHIHYWVYDNPLKIKQNTEVALYTGVEFINDNLVRVSQPDFIVAQSEFTSTYLRRTIGSSDYECGDEFQFTIRTFGSNPEDPQWATQVYGEWSNFSNMIWKHNTLYLKFSAGYHLDNEKVREARFYFGGFGNRELENVDVKQYRKIFRFPGIPMYSLDATRFVKIVIENNLPPLRFGGASIGQHYLNHIDLSIYSQLLHVKSTQGKVWFDIGAQINFIFKHWFNLESTFSAGIAKAWWDKGHSWEGFLSFKLLKN